jgi:membrane associated rhomboid family serine protease
LSRGSFRNIDLNLAWTPVVRFLILTNAVIFLLQSLTGSDRFVAVVFGLVPQLVLTRGWVWQLVTYMFLHHGFWHIFFNMFALWMFGSPLERVWGPRGFLRYYFLTGIGGGLCYLLFNMDSAIPTVGASGAIYGLLVAYAVLFPDSIIYLWFFIPIKAKWFALGFGIIEFAASFRPGDSIAHLAHLGGMVIGYLYLKRGRVFDGLTWRFQRNKQRREAHSQMKMERYLNGIRREVDEILDKINRVGYDGLTKKEQKKLKRASEILREKTDH